MVSHSQYVQPDAYLSPLPSSFDAGTSPLALLEKTCLSVGHPDGKGGKPGSLLHALHEKAHAGSPAKKDGGSQSSPDKGRHPGSPAKPAASPGTSAASSADKAERAASAGGKTDENGNRTKGGVVDRSDSAPIDGPATSQPIPPSLPSLPTPSRPVPGFPSPYPGLPGFPHPAFPYPHPGLPPSFPFSAYSGFSPLGGGLGGMPRPGLPCLDLNCKTCPPSPLAGRPCPLGCSQCTVPAHHGDLSMWLSYSSLFGCMPNTSLFSSLAAVSAASKIPTSLPASSVPSSTSSTGQHFCSWVTQSGICWQRFDSSDELLQHVKSHTSASSSAPPPSSTTPASSPTSTIAAASSASSTTTTAATPSGPIPGLPPATSGRMSPRSSYLSALRFHPYGKPPGGPPHPGLPMGPPGFPPGIGYSALASLYGHRLPASLPHP